MNHVPAPFCREHVRARLHLEAQLDELHDGVLYRETMFATVLKVSST